MDLINLTNLPKKWIDNLSSKRIDSISPVRDNTKWLTTTKLSMSQYQRPNKTKDNKLGSENRDEVLEDEFFAHI